MFKFILSFLFIILFYLFFIFVPLEVGSDKTAYSKTVEFFSNKYIQEYKKTNHFTGAEKVETPPCFYCSESIVGDPNNPKDPLEK